AAADPRAALAERGVASQHRGGGRDGRAPHPLSRVERAGAGERPQRAARGRGADRSAAPVVADRQSAGTDVDRRGGSDLAVEAALAALTSFTLIGPLGLPWWLPIIGVAAIATASAGLRRAPRR